ncbi:MAG: sigma-70 family RNA polymerase sigma factor [Oceanospirillaceae bacterium]|nr:sigma-70 family RNA polymerase sigma factor [Oceanospirillaceae bacterium]
MAYDMQTDLSQLYEMHQGWLANFLKKRLNCSHRAADLVQDTYLKILINGKLPPTAYARQYLSRVAKGLMVDHYRRWRIEQVYLESLQHLSEADHGSPEYHLQIIETLIEIDTLLHNLSDRAREAFLLRRLEGLSYQAIALQMNVSVSSVEKYVAKGLQVCAVAVMEHAL